MDLNYLSYKGLKRLFYTKVLKQISLKVDKTNGDISDTKVRSVDSITTEFPDPMAGENTKIFLGKVKKSLADWKAIKSTLLTLSMLTNQHENSTSKIPTAALVYALNQSLATTNSNLALKADKSDFPYKAIIISYYLSAFTAYGGSYYHDFSISNSGGGIPFLFSSISGANLSVDTSFTGVTATAFRAWASSNAAEAIINILVLIPK